MCGRFPLTEPRRPERSCSPVRHPGHLAELKHCPVRKMNGTELCVIGIRHVPVQRQWADQSAGSQCLAGPQYPIKQ